MIEPPSGKHSFSYFELIFILFIVLLLANVTLFTPGTLRPQKQDQTLSIIENDPITKSNSHFAFAIETQITRGNSTGLAYPKVNDTSVTYAIICPSELTTSVTQLANWKTSKGVPAKVYTLDGPNGIYATQTEGDNATKIHNFLENLHKNNSKLEWVLLVGDEDLIPSRLIFVNASTDFGLDDYYYSDHYYAGYNNSWDQDNDGIFGEQKGDVNWYANMFVGRLPVNNISEADIAINKILKYEMAPESGQWMTNATFWTGLLDGPNNMSAYQAYKDNAIKVTNKILPYIPDHMDLNVLYDYDQMEPGNYTFENDTLNHTSAKQSFYAGQAIINFAGQAYYTGDELAHYDDETGLSAVPNGFGPLFSYNDGKYATNGNKLPFLYLSTCSVNFSEPDDSNLEQLITAPNGGVIGLIGNSGKSYRGETENGSSYGNWWLSQHFWNLFFDGNVQPGKCLYKLKESYVMDVIYPGVPYIQMAVANLVGYNLLGDPELSIWTDVPKMLNLNHSLIYVADHKLSILVTNDSGIPVNNARVCIYNNDIYEYVTTDSSGKVIFDFDPRLTETLQITITAHNYLPIISNITYLNDPPTMQPIPNQTTKVGDTYKYTVDALDTDNDYLLFYDDSQVLEINMITGSISFTPFEQNVGVHIINITVTDGAQSTTQTLRLEVISNKKPPEDNTKEPSFLELYWFPSTVVIVTIIIIVFIKLNSIKHPEKKDKSSSQNQTRDTKKGSKKRAKPK